MTPSTTLILFLVFQGPSPCERHRAFLDQLTEHYRERLPLALSFQGELSDAAALSDCLVDRLSGDWGAVVGYKAALTNPIAQQRFGVDAPLLGSMLENMLLKSGATVPVHFGARPVCEGDLVVRIGDEAVNRARTREDAMDAIDAVIPFLELPDLVYGPDVPLNGAAITAINAGARLGVLGPERLVFSARDWQHRIAHIRIQLIGDDGKLLTEGRSENLLGHPLDAVLWLKDALLASGKRLKKGDLLSLGSATPPIPIRGPGTVTARYFGMEPERIVEVKVTFAGGEPDSR